MAGLRAASLLLLAAAALLALPQTAAFTNHMVEAVYGSRRLLSGYYYYGGYYPGYHSGGKPPTRSPSPVREKSPTTVAPKPSPPPSPSGKSGGVTFYSGADFTGKSKTYTSAATILKFAKDTGLTKLHSLKVSTGFKVTLYRRSGLKGTDTIAVTGPASLASLTKLTWTSGAKYKGAGSATIVVTKM